MLDGSGFAAGEDPGNLSVGGMHRDSHAHRCVARQTDRLHAGFVFVGGVWRDVV